MPVYFVAVGYESTTFPQAGAWDRGGLCPEKRSELSVVSIGVPPGKHDVDMCPVYEEEWRRRAPSVLSSLNPGGRVSFVWAEGPMDAKGLLEIFPYMAGAGLPRYHVESVTHILRDSYAYSWVSFEYSREGFESLMRNTEVDLEYTRLRLLWFDERWVSRLVPKPFESIGLAWILDNDALALSFHRHFEGCYVLGRRDTVEGALRRVQDALPPEARP